MLFIPPFEHDSRKADTLKRFLAKLARWSSSLLAFLTQYRVGSMNLLGAWVLYIIILATIILSDLFQFACMWSLQLAFQPLSSPPQLSVLPNYALSTWSNHQHQKARRIVKCWRWMNTTPSGQSASCINLFARHNATIHARHLADPNIFTIECIIKIVMQKYGRLIAKI